MISFPVWQTDSPTRREFRHPELLGWDGPELFFCGHFDDRDCYRYTDADVFVVVHNDVHKGFTIVGWTAAALWLSDNPEMDAHGILRAVIKARRALVDQIDNVVARLLDATRELQGKDDAACQRGWAVCNEAADIIQELRKGCGL